MQFQDTDEYLLGKFPEIQLLEHRTSKSELAKPFIVQPPFAEQSALLMQLRLGVTNPRFITTNAEQLDDLIAAGAARRKVTE